MAAIHLRKGKIDATGDSYNIPAHEETNDGSNQKQETPRTKANPMVYLVFLSLMFDLLAFTMILPLLPSLLEYFSLQDDSGLYRWLTNQVLWFQELVGAPEKYTSVLLGGFLGSMYSFLQFVASPVVGALSDYYGRKPLLLACTVGIALSYLLWALSRNFVMFVLARFIGGLSKGNISLCMSIVTDVSTPATRSHGMALIGVAFSLSFLMGPMIGAIFAKFASKANGEWGPWFVAPSLLAFTFGVIDLALIAMLMVETLPKEKRVKRISSAMTYARQLLDVGMLFNFTAIKRVNKNQINTLQKLGVIYFLYLFLYSGLEFTVTFLMFHKFNYSYIGQARMFLMTGAIMTILQGAVVRRLPPQATKPCAVFALYLIVPAFIVVGMAETGKMLHIGMALFAISTAFVVTCLTTLVSKYGNDDQKGSVLGIFRSLGALARALGPVVGSIAFWSVGAKITYIAGGILLLYPAISLHRAKL